MAVKANPVSRVQNFIQFNIKRRQACEDTIILSSCSGHGSTNIGVGASCSSLSFTRAIWSSLSFIGTSCSNLSFLKEYEMKWLGRLNRIKGLEFLSMSEIARLTIVILRRSTNQVQEFVKLHSIKIGVISNILHCSIIGTINNSRSGEYWGRRFRKPSLRCHEDRRRRPNHSYTLGQIIIGLILIPREMISLFFLKGKACKYTILLSSCSGQGSTNIMASCSSLSFIKVTCSCLSFLKEYKLKWLGRSHLIKRLEPLSMSEIAHLTIVVL